MLPCNVNNHDYSNIKHALFTFLFLTLFITAGIAIAPTANAQLSLEAANRRCEGCHGKPEIAAESPEDRIRKVAMAPGISELSPEQLQLLPPTRPGLYVSSESLKQGMHISLKCVSCHEDASELPHVANLKTVTCNNQCHIDEQEKFARSIHAKALAEHEPNAPTCASCHGTHNILSPSNRDSMTYPLNIIKVCSDCHQLHNPSKENNWNPSRHMNSYLESTHGEALSSREGLIAAATCSDCHGNHEILKSDVPESKVYRANVPDTCGKCHIGVVELYQHSIHGKKLAEGDPRAPICTDCHTAHSISHPDDPDFMADIVNECGQCHNDPEMAGQRHETFYNTYRASYHGQVNELGSQRAARCSDCHGSHDILPMKDENSLLYGDNLIKTCGKDNCHVGVNAKFVKYDPHADYKDKERYPILYAVWWYFIIVMSGAFGFFGLHTILWFVRSVIDRIKYGPHPEIPLDAIGIRRFTKLNRINHLFVIITFFGLTLTGLPLVFAEYHWARNLADIFGGVVNAGIWHRIFATMLILNFVAHFIGLFLSARRCQGSIIKDWLIGPNSMLPRLQDVRDCIGMFRWFFFGGIKPTFDRWTYWEKFDYWAEVGGSGIIGFSGLLLWFPNIASIIFPGWIFNVAMIIHGYEALLAIGFIFTIHFFNAHLRLEKFPVDDVIFTGQVPEEEFMHERGEEYARLMESNQLAQLRVNPPPRWQRYAAIIIGILAMAIGISLVILIILGGLNAMK